MKKINLFKKNVQLKISIYRNERIECSSEPNTESSILNILPNGRFITIQGEQGDWYKFT